MQWASIKNRVEAIPKHKSPSQSTALFFIDLFINVGSLGAPFSLHLAPFGLHFGYILAPFWSSLASIWPPWGRLGRVARNVHEIPDFWAPFWLHVGTIWAPKTVIF